MVIWKDYTLDGVHRAMGNFILKFWIKGFGFGLILILSSKTFFDLEETCYGDFIWTIKLSKKLLASESVENIVKIMIVEMTVAFVNIQFNALFYITKTDQLFNYENIITEILDKINSLTGFKLKVRIFF